MKHRAIIVVSLCVSYSLAGQNAVAAQVYACSKEGVKIFADKPCGPGAQKQVEIPVPNTYTAAELPAPPPAAKSSNKRKERDTTIEDRKRKEERCRKLSDSLQRIQSKMRAGYRAKEGERLRTQSDQLTEQMRRDKCR